MKFSLKTDTNINIIIEFTLFMLFAISNININWIRQTIFIVQ